MSEPPDVRPEPDFQLTGDDPMLEQIEAATTGRVPADASDSAGPSDVGSAALEPGEAGTAQYEPDASQ